MRRRIVIGAVLLSVLVGVVMSVHLTLPPPRINPTQYDQIREGMTLVEVEGIVGGPPGFYHPNNTICTRTKRLSGREFGWDHANLEQRYWCGTQYEIGVVLDGDGAVVAKQLTEIASRSRWVDDLLRKFGW
jgi:hypothetical protein